MFKLLIGFMLINSFNAMAQIDAAMQINENNTVAEYAMLEKNIDGKLSSFFENLKTLEMNSGNLRVKKFTLSNGRFGLTCKKTKKTSSPSTSCIFFIKDGEITSDINTQIAVLGYEKVATIGLSSNFSSEVSSVFSKQENEMFNHVFQNDHTALEIKGASYGSTVIGFSEF